MEQSTDTILVETGIHNDAKSGMNKVEEMEAVEGLNGATTGQQSQE